MMKPATAVAAICLGLMLPGAIPAATVGQLRCEYRDNPLGIDVVRPRLSWIIESGERGERQTAYRILVASSPEKLAQDEGDLWDSGQVASDRSTQIDYEGKPVPAHQCCLWKVRVWDRRDQPQAWSAPAQWSMGILDPRQWRAQWIGRDDARAVVPEDGKNRYLPATHLRKDFTLRKAPQRAVLYVTGQGMVEPRLNGKKVGDDFLIPGWTDYRKRIYYRAYDVTPQVREGANTVGAILGDGWFRGHLSIIGQNLYGRQTRLWLQLDAFYADGSSDTVASDGSWTAGFGPILAADLYAGETYDARLEPAGWDRPGFANPEWRPVVAGTQLHPAIQAAPGAPVQRTGEIRPAAITRPKPGLHVVDFGRNFAGWVRLRINAPAGTKITMRFGEMLSADGTVYRANLRGARATDCYICKGAGEEVWEPRFTYHGFQYVEVEGLPAPPEPRMFTGIMVGSALPLTGSFACSSDVMTRTADNMRCTIRANLVDIPTDCPQRDERMGWMDYHEVAASTLYEQDAASLLTKWMADIADARLKDGSFSMIAPDVHGFGWSPGWADSSVLIPWTMYGVYGDTRLATRYYREMAGHVEYYRQHSTGLVGPDVGLGDWLAPDMSTPKQLISTALFARGARNMSLMSRALGKADDAARYRQLFQEIRAAFQKKFVHPGGTIGSDSQGGYALALAYDLLDADQVRQASNHLVAAIDARDGHLSTGMVTTHLLLPALSKAGRTDVAYRLCAQKTYPSWGYFLKLGATSIWERWDGKTEKGYFDPGMNSFNHANLGTCSEWFYRTVLGIDSQGPGFKSLIIRPIPGGDLTWARGHYDSPHGRIAVAWSADGRHFDLNVTIPANATALVFIPAADASAVEESGKKAALSEGVTFVRQDGGDAVFSVGSGTYAFRAPRGQ
ncbi:MAG: glycoside hydrolase family 78 protein [Thermoguttaceae bacterium]|jgi:alpha-L-rhamnosidase